MVIAHHRPNRLAHWYEKTKYPGLALVVLVFVLYGPSLFGGFILDDLRNLRLLRAYHVGEHESLGLYQFLSGGEHNRNLREAGGLSWWWVGDDLRYKHLRSVSEYYLYGEFLVFGDRALGYRLVGVALYAFGVLLVLRLFRLMSGDERLSRWGALVFSVAACHVIPVIFVSSHCDVIALVFACGSLLLAGQFAQRGGSWRLGLALLGYGMGLFSKEAVLPVAALPLCLWIVFRGVPGAGRRTAISTTCFVFLALTWLAYYVVGGFGSNALMMQDPLHTPWEYLAALPGRAVLLLSTWLIPVNPFLFRFHHGWSAYLTVYGVVGAIGLAILARMYWRRHRGDRGVVAMALWVLPFLPLLACTAPDDRVMMLPSIGFAFLGAVWMTRPRPDGSRRLRRFPFALFVVVQMAVVLVTSGVMQFMELEARKHLRMMVAAFGREPEPGDHIFFLNTARSFEGLMTQDRLRRVSGTDRIRVSVLSDIAWPRVEVVDERTLRLEARVAPFFSSFLGLMGTSRDRPRKEGDIVIAAGFQGRIARMEDGAVKAVELVFDKPITSDSYRFFWSDSNKPPAEWKVVREAGSWRFSY